MRYLLPILFTFIFACGEDSARPRNKQDQEADLGVDMSETEDMGDMGDMILDDMGCNNALDCMSDEDIQDKLLNLLHPIDHGGFDGRFEFEPVPFEFGSEDEDEEQRN